ncbi:MAG: CPBP family intramembrane metalloprotease [Candidatus Eremiobacteraeota bacterium]|nr:CPBP family intramembrane metalloprotease [Candidatus Eremiobacteraeota bacterium]
MENNSSSPSSPPSPTTFTTDREQALWTILAAIGLIPIALAGVAFGLLLYRAFGGALNPRQVSLWAALTAQLFGYLFLIPYVLFVLRRLWRSSFLQLGFSRPSWRQIGIALLGALAMIIVVTALGQLMQGLLHVHHEQQAVQIFRSIRDPRLALYFSLIVTVATPITEELTFRVFIFNAARRFFPIWPAAIVSGGLFALAHQDPILIIPLGAGGLILCYVYVTTRNAWMSMVTHACFNGFTLAILFIAPKSTV